MITCSNNDTINRRVRRVSRSFFILCGIEIKELRETLCTLWLILLLCTLPATAQSVYNGLVTDDETKEPLEMATVRLVQGSGEALIEYALTDSKGRFSITSNQSTDSLYIMVSMLGYRTQKLVAQPGLDMKIQLQTESINLREVVIKPGRIWGRKDTINYSLADFVSSKDEAMKDVLKKLPGLDVDNNGRISYNGKDISKFYVEGMDLTDGRYNRINNNLQAKAVEAVQVLENHQSVRMLKDKINSEEVAINLKLKPEFRDKWMTNLQGGGGYSVNNPSGHLLWNADVNALQLSRKSQSVYAYKTNNTGNDISTENNMLASSSVDHISDITVPGFLSQPSLLASLKKERLLFNNVHTASANRLFRMNETTQLRVNAGYTHDLRRQQRGSETTYYQAEDTITISEQSDTRIRTDKGELSVHLENNAPERYLTNRFNLTGEWEKGSSDFTGNQTIGQQIRTMDAGLKNEFKSLWNKDSYTLEAASLIRYNHLPSELRLNKDKKHQHLNLNHFYTNNYFAFLKKKGYFTQRYTAGFTAQGSNISNGYSAYITPYWQRNTGKWRTTLSVPLTLTGFRKDGTTHPAVTPFLSVFCKYNYAWQFSLSGSYRESYGSITDFYDTPYFTNYRNSIYNNGQLTIRRNQYYAVYGEYKNTIAEFFATLSVAHQRGWSNRTYEEVVNEQQIALVAHKQSSGTSGWTINGRLSKGFFDYNLKLSLNYIFGWSESEQLSAGEFIPVQSSYMFYEPKLSWNPFGQLNIDYEGTFRYGGTQIGKHTKLSPLLNIIQKINLSYNFSFIELGFSADHYYNDVSNQQGVTNFLLDASLRWRSGSWMINLYANNLLDKRQYGYTQYSALQSYTSWINIRGREFLATVGYRF